MSPRFTITALTREFDVTPRALRFYESESLLSPERRGQARLYSARDRARLSLILRGKRLGFSLREIAELLDLYDPRDGGVTQLDRSLVAISNRIDQLKRQKTELETFLAELTLVQADMKNRRATLPQSAEPPKAEEYDRLLRPRVDGGNKTAITTPGKTRHGLPPAAT